MRFSSLFRILLPAVAGLGALCVGSSWISDQPKVGAQSNSQACPETDSGLTLPAGFCATIFADNIGHARHLAVAPGGVVYVNTWSGDYYPPGDKPPAGGFLVALQPDAGTGKAGTTQRFGETAETGAAGGSGIALYKGSIYAEVNDRIVRYTLPAGSIVPQGPATTVVSGLPLGGDHPMHPFAITGDGAIIVDVGTATNSCQLKNRTLKSPGADPCTELETRGGIWRYDANRTNQPFTPADRYATGIRNGEGFAVDASSKRVFVTQHGRDQLHANWPDLYKPEEEATLPSEELVLLKQGGDYGWPECYYDPMQRKLVLAPEYGGDGGKKVGVCADKIAPVAAFPAHWGPNGAVFYDHKQFPAHYRGGVFIAFHGSWDRAPYPAGRLQHCVSTAERAIVPLVRAKYLPTVLRDLSKLRRRPSIVPAGLRSDRMDRSTFQTTSRDEFTTWFMSGGAAGGGAKSTPCPGPSAAAGEIAQAAAKPPEGTHPDAGLTPPPGATAEMVALGDRIYHGEVGGASCAGCHGASAKGTPLGPDLTDAKWLWSDGSYSGIAKTITEGVMQPKEYRSAMPPMGGAQLTPDQVQALSAYVWALSHH